MLEIIAQRVGVGLSQYSSKLSVTAKVLSEVLSVFAAQRPHKSIASLTPNLAVSVATPII